MSHSSSPASAEKSSALRLFDFKTPAMRAFHMTWFAFFLCFFAWYGLAPLMVVVREEMGLTKSQVGWIQIAAVALTIPARLIIGALCDLFGPRRTYGWLMLVGSLPVMGLGLAHDFTGLLVMRALTGIVGASFVVTQVHTSLMFDKKCIGTANATAAGWGNVGGGLAQVGTPFIMGQFVAALGVSVATGWRLAMLVAGAMCAIFGILYMKYTQDTPAGNLASLPLADRPKGKSAGNWGEVLRSPHVWVLVAIYAACFGMELTMKNNLVLYFVDYFPDFKAMDMSRALKLCGLIAFGYGAMNLFARTVGGWLSDRVARTGGLAGRARFLVAVTLAEGVAMVIFSRMGVVWAAVPMLLIFATTVQMACGATYALVPFVNPRAVGLVSGLVGAGGNVGAVALGFVLKSELPWNTALMVMGGAVVAVASLASLVSFRVPEAVPAPVADSADIGLPEAV